MKLTWAGAVSALGIGLLPFFSLSTILYPGVNAKFFFVVVWALLLLVPTAYSLWKGRMSVSLSGRWLLASLGVVVAVEWFALIAGVYPAHSFWSNIFWASGVFFLTIVALLAVLMGELLAPRDWTLVRRTLVVSSGLFALLSMFGLQGLGFTGKVFGINLAESGLSLGNETYAGAYLLLAFMFGLVEVIRSRAGQWRNLLILSLAAIAASPLLLTLREVGSIASAPAALLGSARASSAALIVFAVFLAGYALMRRVVPASYKKAAVLAWSGVVLAGVSASVVLASFAGNPLHELYVRESSAARPIVWSASWGAIIERPFLGWGPENFPYAFQGHLDPQLFLKENLGEIWFEKAHNVFIDTLINVGAAGLASYGLLIVAFLLIVARARKKGAIGEYEQVILSALPFAHLLQMQTGFDTVATYTLLGVIGAYALSLERSNAAQLGRSTQQALAAVCALLIVVVGVLAAGEYARQAAVLGTIRATSAAEQKRLIDASLTRPSDFESLRMLSSSFEKGALASIAEGSTPQKVALTQEFLSQYETYFQAAIEEMPDDYRARMNYAYLLLIKTGLGEDRAEDAKAILLASYELSPRNPVTYILHAVAELYSGNLQEADRLMEEALALSPDSTITKEAAAYLRKQKASYPSISILRFTNL